MLGQAAHFETEPFRFTTARWHVAHKEIRRTELDGTHWTERKALKAICLTGHGVFDTLEYESDTLCAHPHRGGCQIALVTTPKSQLLVVDVDDEGFDVTPLGLYVKKRGHQPVSTRGADRGLPNRHYLVDMRLMAGRPWPSQGPITYDDVSYGDIKSNGFIAAPGSTHPCGDSYEPTGHNSPIPCDEELHGLLMEARRGRPIARATGGGGSGHGGGQRAQLTSLVGSLISEWLPKDEALKTWLETTSAMPQDPTWPWSEGDFEELWQWCMERHLAKGGTYEPNWAEEHPELMAWAKAIHATPLNTTTTTKTKMETRTEMPETGTTGSETSATPLEQVDVTNPALAADWLLESLGTGALSGMFYRAPDVVFAPQIGEDGYIPLTEDDANDDGPAQVRPVTPKQLAARVRHRFECTRTIMRTGKPLMDDHGQPVTSPALFPVAAAEDALAAPEDVPNLRPLRGVVHAPTVRADGSILDQPGYDETTRLLHLPEPGLSVPVIPVEPSIDDVKAAVRLLDEMVADFPFVSDHYRANFIGALLTPLLRVIAPPAYKLVAIEAHQPGSGKTLLAEIIRALHGGVFRSEMPADDAELGKQVTSILSVTTGPVVVFDNVSGVLRSSKLAGLLTSDRWDDRPLGVTDFISRANDRLWVVTANNLAIGGDLARRTLRVAIDPGSPNPELRTEFTIPDLPGWVAEHRGGILHALLVLVRAWVVAGRPLGAETSSDGYAPWVRTVRGILNEAGVPGIFDDRSTQTAVGTDDDDWGDFLAAVRRVFGGFQWTAKDVLSLVASGQIPREELPGELLGKLGPFGDPLSLSKTLGRWLANRKGRWAGQLCVTESGADRDKVKMWVIRTYRE